MTIGYQMFDKTYRFRRARGFRVQATPRMSWVFGIFMGVFALAHTSLASLTWSDVENQIQFHRQRVRMCGPLSAARLLTLRGHDVPAGEWLEQYSRDQPQGIRVRELMELLRGFEPSARAVHVDPEIIAHLPKPCILLVNDRSHCVTLESWNDSTRTAVVWDPSDLKQKPIPMNALRNMWSGESILIVDSSWVALLLSIANVATLLILTVRIAQRWRRRPWARSHAV